MTFGSQRPGRIVFRDTVGLVVNQGDLGVDDQVALAGQVDDHIRLSSLAVLARIVLLGMVFVPGAQAGGLQNPLQDQLSPSALRFTRPPQRAGQVVGLLGEPGVGLEELVDLGAQMRAAPHLLHAGGFDLVLKVFQPGLEGLENLAQAGLVLLRETAGFFFQNLAGQRLEGLRQI